MAGDRLFREWNSNYDQKEDRWIDFRDEIKAKNRSIEV
jgi:hypothetical protein